MQVSSSQVIDALVGQRTNNLANVRHLSWQPTRERSARPWWKLVPSFIIGFLIASALETVGAIPAGWHPALADSATALITVALAGIGLALKPADMAKAGHRPLLLGGILWIAVAASSLTLQALTGQL